MSKTATLYDKTGAAFKFDHEHDGKLYVRPLVKVVFQANYGDDYHEEEGFEPAGYIVAKAEDELFYAPPVEALNADIKAKTDELAALKAEAKKAVSDINSEKIAAERELQTAKRQLEQWMETHRSMFVLGKLLDGQVMYPLTVKGDRWHRDNEVPHIPAMQNSKYISLTSGDFEKGQKWVARRHSEDSYGSPFTFFETEEERAAAIQSQFETALQKFRNKPNFSTDSYSSALIYGTLVQWVRAHPSLKIPDDIEAMKAANDAGIVEQRKAKLAAELAAMSGEVTQ